MYCSLLLFSRKGQEHSLGARSGRSPTRWILSQFILDLRINGRDNKIDVILGFLFGELSRHFHATFSAIHACKQGGI